jgi:hypothetical protein
MLALSRNCAGQKPIQFRKDGNLFRIIKYLSLNAQKDKCMGRVEPTA